MTSPRLLRLVVNLVRDLFSEMAKQLPTSTARDDLDDPDCSDDLLIAQMLQMEFDKEHDQALKSEERHQNKGSKVTVSYAKYKVSKHP